ncbi:cbb3-type cytochrome oxidase assembly protein CcoS [Beggiatoa leptomitoformis]|uniref:Cbb3-type cytochrome oxidase assembly protein CcoS n=1 Tax=Beggiatoa leptomitoformis TaxID=288004 RepID=A0A2N9YFB7_9GAMM|nr:cbb3-type cytochrome oxidase assembly protein CcoS [Beggiatoa leptomitoformis]ALG68446.1 cbb3-type cytochrome oxidase assembly protein CcoS [Beggiatoa leptomitoformis]AUI69221.1 cbb3-type cytochrome oxidase assembly protein CcoS [Beggiatoa leptomitoformis]
MDILYLLIPLSLVLISLIIGTFLWAIHSGQFDDLEGPAHEILMDKDDIIPPKTTAIDKQ